MRALLMLDPLCWNDDSTHALNASGSSFVKLLEREGRQGASIPNRCSCKGESSMDACERDKESNLPILLF